MSSGWSATLGLCCAYTAGPCSPGISARWHHAGQGERPRPRPRRRSATRSATPRAGCHATPRPPHTGRDLDRPDSVHTPKYSSTTRSTGSGRRPTIITPTRSDPVQVIRVAPDVPANSYTGACGTVSPNVSARRIDRAVGGEVRRLVGAAFEVPVGEVVPQDRHASNPPGNRSRVRQGVRVDRRLRGEERTEIGEPAVPRRVGAGEVRLSLGTPLGLRTTAPGQRADQGRGHPGPGQGPGSATPRLRGARCRSPRSLSTPPPTKAQGPKGTGSLAASHGDQPPPGSPSPSEESGCPTPPLAGRLDRGVPG